MFAPIWLIVVGCLVAAYFLATPLLIFTTFWHEAQPTLVPVPDVNDLPEPVLEYFSLGHSVLTPLGFKNVGTLSLPKATANVKATLALFQNQRDETGCLLQVFYVNVNGVWKMYSKYAEFCTSFEDDSEINTANNEDVGSFPRNPNDISTQHPAINDLKTLYEAHMAKVRHYGLRKRPRLVLNTRFNGNVKAYLSWAMNRELRQGVDAGYIKLSVGQSGKDADPTTASPNPYQSNSAADVSVFRATLWGAYLMSWKELWPIKPLFRWRKMGYDTTLLAKTGYVAPTESYPKAQTG
ncbi:MAG: hypothetical protein AAFN77_07090 [Planctomycetota bacterium]